MSKLTILALLITAAGGCAAADEPWTPTASANAKGIAHQLISGADIPSVLVDPAATYAPGRSIVVLEQLGQITPAQAKLARALDGAIDARANGLIEAAELVQAEESIDFDEVRDQLAALWELLKQIP